MTTNQLPTPVVAADFDKAAAEARLSLAFEAHENGQTGRLVAYAVENGEPRQWNPMTDMHLSNLVHAKAGIEAILKYFLEEAYGSPTLIFVAPKDKLAAVNGTGTMAYVSSRHDPAESVDIEVNGAKLALSVNPQDIPTANNGEMAWQRLRLSPGHVLYAESWEKPFTVRDADPWTFWYCTALSALLSGYTVSVGIGPKLIEKKEQALAVANSDNPVVANETRKYAGRQSAAARREVRANTEVIKEVAAFAGGALALEAGAMIVEANNGDTVDLAVWLKSKPIAIVNAAGVALVPFVMNTGDDTERLAIARTIQSRGLKVVVS